MKLLDPSKDVQNSESDKAADRYDPLRQTASTSAFSKFENRDLDLNSHAAHNMEESKSPRQELSKPNIRDMNAMRQSEPFFNKKKKAGESLEMEQRFGTAQNRSRLGSS